MIRWSPISNVSSIEPEGITRAWPSVPLINMKARMTQNQAMISLFTREPMGAGAAAGVADFFSVLAVTFHRHCFVDFVRRAFGNFQLHQARGVIAGITRCAEIAGSIVYRLTQTR